MLLTFSVFLGDPWEESPFIDKSEYHLKVPSPFADETGKASSMTATLKRDELGLNRSRRHCERKRKQSSLFLSRWIAAAGHPLIKVRSGMAVSGPDGGRQGPGEPRIDRGARCARRSKQSRLRATVYSKTPDRVPVAALAPLRRYKRERRASEPLFLFDR
jgi:hypothetical protein